MLSTLSILTLLFAMATRLSLSHIQSQEMEIALAKRDVLHQALLGAAGEHLAQEAMTGAFEVVVGDKSYTLFAQDVGGLVDLNTSAPALLETYLSAIGLTAEEINQYRDWRKTPRRLLRVADLLRVTEAEGADLEVLLRTATVHSGRTGVSFVAMPEELRALFGARWQEAWEAPVSGVNFRVDKGDGPAVSLGSVHLGQSKAAAILQ